MVAGLTAARFILVGLFRKLRQETVLQSSLLIAATGFALLLFSPGFVQAATGMVLVGAGLASTFPVILGIIGGHYPTLSGTAFSVALVIALTGNTLLNQLTGQLSQHFGIQTYPYTMLIAIVLMLSLFRYISTPKQTNE